MINYNNGYYMKYKIEYTETLQRIIEIEANSEAEALSIADEKYYSEEIILDDNDYKGVEISIIK